VQIRPFEIERYYERWEFSAELMLSSSDCETMALGELLALEPDAEERLRALRLGYTEVAGSPELRAAIASRHEHAQAGDVLAVAAAEEGIFATYNALLGPDDHAIVETPCYGSALEVARSTGADVSAWQRRHEDGWAHDVEQLERMLRPNTALIYINSPHNPTGLGMRREVFDRVVALARENGAVLFSDEVYRGLEHDPATRLPSACDAYHEAVSLGAVSKAHGLPGLRVAWLVCRDAELRQRISDMKLYTTICSSAPSELLLALALRHEQRLVERSRTLVFANLPLVDELLERRSELFSWVRPDAAPIGFAAVAGIEDVRSWCEEIALRAGVLLLPGGVYEQPDHVRIGFGRAQTPQAIARLDEFLG
jgi:aspartate/methionine/tyrosine aminotransferase